MAPLPPTAASPARCCRRALQKANAWRCMHRGAALSAGPARGRCIRLALGRSDPAVVVAPTAGSGDNCSRPNIEPALIAQQRAARDASALFIPSRQ